MLVGLSTAALAGVRLVNRGEIIPGVSVEGIDIGGLSPEDARTALAETVASRHTDEVAFTFEGERFVLQPERIAYHIDLDATIEQAMALGREGGAIGNTVEHVRAFWEARTLELAASHDEQALEAWIDEVAGSVERETSFGDLDVDPSTFEVTATVPVDGVVVRRDETRTFVLQSLLAPGPDETGLPVDRDPTPISAAELEAVVAQAERAVAAPLVLTAPDTDATITLDRTDVARLVDVRVVGADEERTLELFAPVHAVAAIFSGRTDALVLEPVSAQIVAPKVPAVTLDAKADVTWRPRPADIEIVPSTPGRAFDPELAATQLSALIREGRREAELRLAEVEADLTTEQARELGIDELIGTFTTYHPCCRPRVHNIQRLADMVDNTLVLPGEQFSVNQISGNRTCARGFVEDGMILNGEIVPVCGGGVSQFGTTTVNAVFFSGLEPDTYKPHSFYISRYPMGREATLNYPSPDIDVRFTNDTGHGILVRTSYTPSSITVTFYGHTDVESVTAIHGEPYNYKPYKTRERVNRELPPGARVTTQSGQQGFSINVSRVIVYEDGREKKDDWSNVYTPELEIIEYNPDQPEPEPEPKPEPEPSPSESPTEGSGDGGSGGDGSGGDDDSSGGGG